MLKEILRSAVQDAIALSFVDNADVEGVSFVIERPKNKEHGDYSTNAALLLSGALKTPPREIAERISNHLAENPFVSKTEVAGPGFVNFFLNNSWFSEVVRDIHISGNAYGSSAIGAGKRVQIEFVSANPVGPLHVGHGRWAVIGDTLASLLKFAGYAADKEFYINDHGLQINNFALSLDHFYKLSVGIDSEFPENGYRGSYIAVTSNEISTEFSAELSKLDGEERLSFFRNTGYSKMIAWIERSLASLDVHFDKWYRESELYKSGRTDEVMALLKDSGLVYEKDGATWLATSNFKDEKDRVIVRADGEPTYFLADIAYHKDKMDRGYDSIIDIWGADHHGYIGRVKAAVQALGYDKERLEIIIGQLVNLFRDGEAVRMSKRTGEIVTLDELVEEVGGDAIRYMFSKSNPDTSVDFDIELVKKRSSDNPVFYIQYAHARICSILRKAEEEGYVGVINDSALSSEMQAPDLSMLDSTYEAELIKKLVEFEEIIEKAAARRTPYYIPTYLEELATLMHSFYTNCRVIGDDRRTSIARLQLISCVRIVIANGLGVLGVSAPQKM